MCGSRFVGNLRDAKGRPVRRPATTPRESGEAVTDVEAGAGDRRNPAGVDSPAIGPAVAQLAERRGLGGARATHTLGGGDIGCLGLVLAIVLLAPGIGLLVGPYGTAATTLGAVFLVLAAALPVAALRYEKHRGDRIPRLHLFDGGIVITTGTGITAHPWQDIRVVERSESMTIGGGSASRRVDRLRLHDLSGDLLCSLGDAVDTADVVRMAIAGGATR